MKRNNEKVPEFDEIIFENRNKSYGAYYLRKHYKSATSISILGAIALSTLLILALSFTPEKGKASPGEIAVTLVMSDPVKPVYVKPPELKAPPALTKAVKYLKPVVTDDTSKVTKFTPSTDQIIETVQNGNVIDNPTVIEPSDPVIPVETKPFIRVEEMPEFPGGLPALLKFVGENLIYPPEAEKNNIQGRVTLKFVVNPDGSVGTIEIIRGVDPLLDTEAVRVVKTLPKFKPGRQRGIPVPVWFSLPVFFQINNN